MVSEEFGSGQKEAESLKWTEDFSLTSEELGKIAEEREKIDYGVPHWQYLSRQVGLGKASFIRTLDETGISELSENITKRFNQETDFNEGWLPNSVFPFSAQSENSRLSTEDSSPNLIDDEPFDGLYFPSTDEMVVKNKGKDITILDWYRRMGDSDKRNVISILNHENIHREVSVNIGEKYSELPGGRIFDEAISIAGGNQLEVLSIERFRWDLINHPLIDELHSDFGEGEKEQLNEVFEVLFRKIAALEGLGYEPIWIARNFEIFFKDADPSSSNTSEVIFGQLESINNNIDKFIISKIGQSASLYGIKPDLKLDEFDNIINNELPQRAIERSRIRAKKVEQILVEEADNLYEEKVKSGEGITLDFEGDRGPAVVRFVPKELSDKILNSEGIDSQNQRLSVICDLSLGELGIVDLFDIGIPSQKHQYGSEWNDIAKRWEIRMLNRGDISVVVVNEDTFTLSGHDEIEDVVSIVGHFDSNNLRGVSDEDMELLADDLIQNMGEDRKRDVWAFFDEGFVAPTGLSPSMSSYRFQKMLKSNLGFVDEEYSLLGGLENSMRYKELGKRIDSLYDPGRGVPSVGKFKDLYNVISDEVEINLRKSILDSLLEDYPQFVDHRYDENDIGDPLHYIYNRFRPLEILGDRKNFHNFVNSFLSNRRSVSKNSGLRYAKPLAPFMTPFEREGIENPEQVEFCLRLLEIIDSELNEQIVEVLVN